MDLMRKTLSIKTWTLVPLAAAALVGVMATPAFAVLDNNCTAGEACMYEHDNKAGGKWQTTGDDLDLYNNFWYQTTNRVEDGASSLWNRKTCNTTWYQDDGHSGAPYILGAGGSNNDLDSTGFEDEISSINVTC